MPFGARRVLLAASVSGVLCGLGCPPSLQVLTVPVGWIWAVPFLIAARHASARLFIAGTIVAGVLAAIGTTAGAGAALGYLGIVYFAVAGLCYAAPMLLIAPLRRWLGQDSALWALPPVAALTEWFLFRVELGWNNLAASQAGATGLIQFVDLFGQPSITFWLMLINVLLYRELVRPAGRRVRRIALVFALTLGIPAVYSFIRLQQSYGSGRPIEVLLVQPNTTQSELQPLFSITDAAVLQSKPDLIVWPEMAVAHVLNQRSPLLKTIGEAVADWGTPLVTGALDDARRVSKSRRFLGNNKDLANAAVLFTPGPPGSGADQVRMAEPYHKRRLVPFIEGVPLGLDPSWVKKLNALPDRGFTLERGARLRTLSYRDDAGQMIRFAVPICYEDLYSEDLTEFARNGAQFFAVITNDSWFGRWETAYTHAALGRLRAIETRRPLVQAATTGWTLAINAHGEITKVAPWWQPAIARATIQPNDSLTFYTRFPLVFPILCAVWLAVLLLFHIARRRGSIRDR